MKKIIYYTNIRRETAVDLHLVSTRWQIGQLQQGERNREGIGIRKNIATLESYAAKWVSAQPVSRARLLHLIRTILASVDAGRYRRIAPMQGFVEALFLWLQTLIAERVPPGDLTPELSDLKNVYAQYLLQLEKKGWITREHVLIHAADNVGSVSGKNILISGFIDFRTIELDFLDALAKNNALTLLLSHYGETPFAADRESRLTERGWMVEKIQNPVEDTNLSTYTTAASDRLLSHSVWTMWAMDPHTDTDIVVSGDAVRKELIRQAKTSGIPLASGISDTVRSTRIGRDVLRLLQVLRSGDSGSYEAEVNELLATRYPTDELPEEADLVLPGFAQAKAQPLLFMRAFAAWYQAQAFSDPDADAEAAAAEYHAAQAVLSICEDWEELGTTDPDALYSFVRDALEEMVLPVRSAVQGVRVLTLQECAGISVKRRIFAGFPPDFPKTESANFLLRGPMAQKEAVLSPAVQFFKEMLRMDDACAHAEKVEFVLPYDGGTPSFSPLIAERLVSGRFHHRALRVPDAASLLSKRDAQMYRAYHGLPHEADALADAFHTYRGQTGAGELTAGERSYSSGSLDSYSQCPFRFWLDYILHVDTKDSGILLERGNVMHRVLGEYYTLKKDEINRSLDAGELPSMDEDTVRRLLASAIADAESAFARPLQKEMEQQLTDYIRMDLLRLFDTPGYRLGSVESPFHFSIGTGKQKIGITGRIDRSDHGPPGEPEWITDYKTGSIPSLAQIRRGEAYQLPLYSMSRLPLAHVYYGGLKETKLQAVYMPDAYPAGKSSVFNEAEWKSLLAQLEVRITEIDEMVRNGNFPVTPSEPACRHCSYASVCRREELE